MNEKIQNIYNFLKEEVFKLSNAEIQANAMVHAYKRMDKEFEAEFGVAGSYAGEIEDAEEQEWHARNVRIEAERKLKEFEKCHSITPVDMG